MAKTTMTAYSRLEHYCIFDLQTDKNTLIELSYSGISENVYVEEYQDFSSLKNRIIELYELWQVKYPYRSSYDRKMGDRDNNLRKIKMDAYPDLILYNRWKGEMFVGVCPLGWKVSIIFFGYILRHLENLYGKEAGSKIYNQIAKNQIAFYTVPTEPTYTSICELVSEETADLIIQEFLDKNKIEHDLDPEIFLGELKKRDYSNLNIIN
jgi:hypothetical protein